MEAYLTGFHEQLLYIYEICLHVVWSKHFTCQHHGPLGRFMQKSQQKSFASG